MKTERGERRAIDVVIREALERAAQVTFDLDEPLVIEIAEPRERGHGDLASNLALKLAKSLRRSPREIAERLATCVELDPAMVERVEVAGAGFLNFHLAPPWVREQVRVILEAAERFGTTKAARPERIQVEFVSANPTGPLNVVSARAAAVGDSLVRLLRAAGHHAAAEFYVNDAGTQVDLLGASLDAHWQRAHGVDAEIPEEGYHGDYVTQLALEIADTGDLAAWTPAARRSYFQRQGLARILVAQQRVLARFGVEYDCWFRESELHERGELDAVLERLRESGSTVQREGAIWFQSTQYGDDADRVIVRSDGRPTYLLADIAYHADKRARGFERVIDIWGPDHHGHIARMQAAAQALGFGCDWLEVLIVQQVNLVRGGEPVKMSKRRGEFITLEEIEDEVGRDPARFFFLMRKVNAHLDFDLELAKNQSEENPCLYVQYGHARIASILDHARERGQVLRPIENVNLSRLEDASELALIKRLAALPEIVRACASTREPQRLTAYLRDVAADFHRFYHHQRVVGVEEELSQARLALVRATRIVLANGLQLIGLSAPDRM